VFDRFDEDVRRAVAYAREEAAALRHSRVDGGHLLLGLLRVADGAAARMLDELDVDLDEARAQVALLAPPGSADPADEVPLAREAERILDFALHEAVAAGANAVSTEHVLLAISREAGGVGARILRDFDVDDGSLRRLVARVARGEGEILISVPPTGADAGDEDDVDSVTGDLVRPSWTRNGYGRRAASTTPLALAIVLAALGFPLGLLVGYLIWG
jgi:ATP-dependent Clp protease ATP-binding subunit ClpC